MSKKKGKKGKKETKVFRAGTIEKGAHPSTSICDGRKEATGMIPSI